MKKIYRFLTVALAMIGLVPAMAFAADTASSAPLAEGDDEEEEPYIEPPFTVYIDIDNADAVYFTINDQPIGHTAGLNTITVDPGDGYIKVHVNDGYAFTKFHNEDLDSDYLQYEVQTMPVTIRKAINLGDGDVILVDGTHFTVNTLDKSSYEEFTLTVNVDNASKAELRIGTSLDMPSSNNRTVSLVNGENTVTFTAMDKYLHVSGSSWFDPLQSVTFNGKKVQGDGQLNAVYTIQLKGSKTAGGVLDVVTKPEPQTDKFSFTAIFDDADLVKYVTKMPAGKDMNFVTGENTFTFNAGDYYQIWTRQQAYSCTFNDNDVEYDDNYGYYSFYPTNGGTLLLSFSEPAPEPMTFTIEIDDLSLVDSFEDEDENVIALTEGVNTIVLPEEGKLYYLYPVNRTEAYSCTLDDEDVAFFKKHLYEFAPVDGSRIVVRFHEPAVEPELNETFVVVIEDPDSLFTDYEMLTGAEREIELDRHFTAVPFDSETDEYVLFAFDILPAAVYVNGETLEASPDMPGVFAFVPADGDILRIYFGEEAPESHMVTFSVDERVAGSFTIMRDHIQGIDHSAGASNELHGTYYVITPNGDTKLKVTLSSIDVTPVAPHPTEISTGAAHTTSTGDTEVAIEDGKYTFRVTDNYRVNIQLDTPTGVESVTVDDESGDIYNLRGVKVSSESLDNLPAGLYIQGDRKILVK